MTEENKTDTAPVAEEQSEANVADATEEQSEEEAKPSDNSIDYETELKKERDAREKAEKALAEDRYRASERRRKGQGEEEEVTEPEKPLTAKQLNEILAQNRAETQKEIQASRISELAGRLAESELQKSLVIEIHKNRSFPEHLSLEEQIEEAFAIANRKKLIGDRNEALRALKGKSGVNKNPATTYQDAPQPGEPQLSATEKAALTQVGFAWNITAKRYEKKLSNGQTLVRDQKTKQTYLVPKK